MTERALRSDDPNDASRWPVHEDDDDLLATMSHELRAPLHAILGWVQLLRAGGTADPDTDRALEIIERNARTEARAVDEAIDLARIASGRMEIRDDELRLAEALRAGLAGCEPLAKARGIRIAVHADGELRVRGDLGRLAQIARGLVTSALRRSVAGGIVEVRLARSGASVVLSVREDHDAGAASGETASTDDERNAARQRRLALIGDGRGLSVAVARGLVRLHGGTIEEEDGGAALTVRLPLARPARTSAQRVAAMSP